MLDTMRATPASANDIATPLAEARGLTLDIGGKRLIDGLDLNLPRGTLTIVLGPNGAGKSLLLRLLHGMIEPSAGAILWEGRPLDESMRRQQAMVFQKPVLLRRSVAANIAFVLKLRGHSATKRCEEVLDHVGLLAHAHQPARLLSGGEQQRLALARALALAPRVLFLDEPTASLDPPSTLAIEEIVTEARAGGTKIVCITHDIGQAKRLAEDVVFLHRGRVVEHRPAKAFFARPSSGPARDYLAGKIVL